jgi:[ribosomal protein S5]-alanine N-acetyltransferase
LTPTKEVPEGLENIMQLLDSVFTRLPELTTTRLNLRAMRMSDARDIFEYSCDPQVARHVLWEAHQNIHQTRAYIRYVLRQYRAGTPSSFCIELKDTGKVIGTIGFMWVSNENRSAEVGYSLSRSYWNKGIMTEALRETLRFGFDTLNLNRIEAQHECDNPASGKVMEHVGMIREGTLRQRLYNKSRFVDVELYAILRDEWRKIHGNGR